MKNKESLIYGITISVVIFIIVTQVGALLNFKTDFIPRNFIPYTLMWLLSLGGIYFLRKYVQYSIALPKLKKILKPILLGISTTIIINIFSIIITKALGGNFEKHPVLSELTPLQILIFIFIYASIAEEILFRGFLLNILKPLSSSGINIFNRKISYSVIISALAFGLSHLNLVRTDVGGLFIMRIVIFTTALGLIAGYYQEKYNNNAYAIIVHMAGNLPAVIGAFLIH